MKKTKPAWTECPDCDEFWCNIHNEHAHDCPCPGIEAWAAHDKWPYEDDFLCKIKDCEDCLEMQDEEDCY